MDKEQIFTGPKWAWEQLWDFIWEECEEQLTNELQEALKQITEVKQK